MKAVQLWLSSRRGARLAAIAGALAAGALSVVPPASAAHSDTLVINEVYGGGGNSGANINSEYANQVSDHDPQVVRLRT